MKHFRHFVFFVLVFSLPVSKVYSQNWQLVWSDEFTSSISSDWVFETGNGSGGWGNNELEYYRSENASVQNGQLVIAAKHESYGGFNYTSVRMKTQGKKSWKYGKVEARIAMPAFQGIWPAFWMLGDNISSVGWPACGEIDIMEHVNAENKTYGTAHWSDNNGNHASYGGNTGVAVTGYHVYSIEWNANAIKWFVDGTQYHVIDITNGINGTGEFQNNFFILLNMAVGGNWPGFTIDNNAFPAYMYVDYVRVYKDAGASSTTTVQAEAYGSMSGVQIESTTDTGGGSNVGYIETGDWMAYTGINFPYTGNYQVEYRVASLSGGGRLSMDLNAGSTVLGYLDVPSTGGWQNWTTISHTVSVTAGTYNVGIYAQAGGWNLNWFRITYLGALKAALADISPNLTTEQGSLAKNFEIYPNPVRNQLNIRSGQDLSGGQAIVYDVTGRQVLFINLSSDKIDVSNLERGTYTLVFTKNGQSVTKRFIK
jgi:beta-glucanase (GH16 family)